MTQPIYAIGDIHGQIDMLHHAIEMIDADGGRDAHVVFLGDYVDRGPDSRGVIETLIAGQKQGRNWTTLMGNHDRMFKWFMQDQRFHDPRLRIDQHWFHRGLGGFPTMASYGVEVSEEARVYELHAEAVAKVPAEHVEFLASLKTHLQLGPYLFVHAGIKPGVPLAEQHEDDLVWIREPFLNFTEPHPWLVVHGHTALEAPAYYGNRLNLDSGAGFGRPLTVAVLQGDTKPLRLTMNGRVKI